MLILWGVVAGIILSFLGEKWPHGQSLVIEAYLFIKDGKPAAAIETGQVHEALLPQNDESCLLLKSPIRF